MKIGIVPMLDPNAGGIYQYSMTMLDALCFLKKKGKKDDYIIFAQEIYHKDLDKYINCGLIVKPLKPSSFINNIKKFISLILGNKLCSALYTLIPNKPSRSKSEINQVQHNYSQRKWFQKFSVDLMIYPAPNNLSFETGIPYIISIHDLQHKIQPEFPEVSSEGEWEEREYLYRNGIKYATLILTESQIGREDIEKYYNNDKKIYSNRIKILPYLPAVNITNNTQQEVRRVLKKYQIPKNYLFYPAAFWPHKNHLRIIKAIGLIGKKYNQKIPAVFCGSHMGKFRKEIYNETKKIAEKLGVEAYFLDYIDQEDLYGLYKNARALIMPTFFGPTNIPVLEAWSVGCPVITSDICGIREQSGNAAILVDPLKEEIIAKGIKELITNNSLRTRLINNGYKKITAYKFSDYCKILSDSIVEAKNRLKSPLISEF